MREGPLSAAAHGLLAVAVLFHVVRDPFGLGALILLEFAFSQLCVKLMKHGVKACAKLVGIDSADAFWRRPKESGRGVDSPGWPSSHTANTASISVFIALQTEASGLWPALLTLMMAAGRLHDRSHRVSQTIAGVVLGPALALAAHFAVNRARFDTSGFGWRVVCGIAMGLATVFFLGKTLPAWLEVAGVRPRRSTKGLD